MVAKFGKFAGPQLAFGVVELCHRWRVTAQTILNLISSGRLKAFNVGSGASRVMWRVPLAEVERFEAGEGMAVGGNVST